MLLQDPLPLETGERSMATRSVWLLEWAGCYWATLVVVPIGVVLILAPRALLVYAPQLSKLSASSLIAVRSTLIALWVLLDVPFLWRLWLTWSRRGSHEMSLYVAAMQPLLHPFLRPLVAAWWVGHFAIAIRLGAFAESITPMHPMTALPFFCLMIFCAASASNIFLIHAVAALTRGPAVQRVWSWRGVYDVGLVAVGLVWKLAAHR